MERGRMAVMVLTLLAGVAWAQPGPTGVEQRELIFCSDLMTHEERDAYRATMQAARTLDEKSRVRADHRATMQARAAGKGAMGNCEPRPGQGPRQGAGLGQGPGGPRR